MSDDDAVLAALREVGLPERHRAEVVARLRDFDPRWRSCCGGFCEPCATALGRAVDRARELLAGSRC